MTEFNQDTETDKWLLTRMMKTTGSGANTISVYKEGVAGAARTMHGLGKPTKTNKDQERGHVAEAVMKKHLGEKHVSLS